MSQKEKLKTVIKRLSAFYGKPYDNSSNKPEILDVLIATKLAQNSTDKSAYVAYGNLKKKFGTWENVSKARFSSIRDSIKVCGLSNTKAANIKDMLIRMKKNYGSLDLKFMNEFATEKIYKEFLQYDGIGIKTISCVLIFAMGRDAFPVDTHVHRVLNRLGLVKTNSPVKTYEQMDNIIPKGKKYELHSELIKFGRNICSAVNPLCGNCFLYDVCEFPDKKFYKDKKTALKTVKSNFIILENI